jgi:hypothetical protein
VASAIVAISWKKAVRLMGKGKWGVAAADADPPLGLNDETFTLVGGCKHGIKTSINPEPAGGFWT